MKQAFVVLFIARSTRGMKFVSSETRFPEKNRGVKFGFVAGSAIIRVLGNQSPDKIARELEGLGLVFSVFVLQTSMPI